MINDDASIMPLPAPPIKQRRIWITVILTLLDPGLGLIYCGNISGGIVLSTALFLIGLLPKYSAKYFWLLAVYLVMWLIIIIGLLIFNIKYTKRVNNLEKPWVKNTWYWIILVFVVILLLGFIKDHIPQLNYVQAFKIPAGSMENTLLVGDYLIANKNLDYRDIQYGDLIVFYAPVDNHTKYIKRVIAKAGQTIEIRDKNVYVDGKLEPLPHEGKHDDKRTFPYSEADSLQWGRRDNMPIRIIPEGKLFVMGDNRDNSFDSRFWGYLDEKDVIGKALYIHFSVDRQAKNIRWWRIGKRLD
jgi:signal peptidase I